MIIAVDMGYATIKYSSGKSNVGSFPARVVPVDGIPRELMGADIMQIKTQLGEWFVGETADRQGGRTVIGRRHEDYVMTKEWKALLFTAVSELVSQNTHEIEAKLVLALPYQDYVTGRDSLLALKGTHQIERPNRRNLKITVSEVLVVPQCYAAVADMSSTFDYRGAIDIGGRTIGVATFDKKGLWGGKTMNRSNNEGVLDVLDSIADEFSAKLKGKYSSREVAAMAAKDNWTVWIDKKPYSAEEYAIPKLQSLADTIYRFASESWGEYMSRIDTQLIGGGVIVLQWVMERDPRFKQFEFNRDPVFANVSAMYRMGQAKW